MRFFLKHFVIFCAPACILLYAGDLYAEEYQPVKAGGFLLTPKLELEQKYDDNIFTADGNEESDFISAAKPSLLIEKSIRDHQFRLENKAEIDRYWENPDQDVFNYKSELTGRVVARRVLTLPFKVSYGVDHLDRRHERSATLSRKPTAFKSLRTEIGADYRPGRVGLAVSGGYNMFRYDNGESFAGAPVVRDDGDYNSVFMRGRVRYTTRTDITPFFSLMVADNNYLRRTHGGGSYGGVKRDNRVVQAMAGAEFDYHDILKGEASVGHDWRRYEDAAVENIGAVSALGAIEWKPFRKLSLALDFLRQSEDDNVVNSGVVQTAAMFGLKYELRHDLFFTGETEWERTKFSEGDRVDNIYGGSAGVSYVLNKRLEAGASYLHRWRDSSQATSDFDENVFMLRLTGKL